MSAHREASTRLRRVSAFASCGLLALVVVLGTTTLADLSPNDPKLSSQYGPQLLGAPAAWSTTTGATSATICFLDTGVRRTHEDLAGNYAGGIDFVNNDNDPADDNGHGTKVAGIAAAAIGNGKGIAGIASVPFKSVKVIDASGSARGDNIVKGIRWCADNGARIVSMSFAGSGIDPAVQDAVEYAWSKGLLLVAGTGNGGCNDCVLYPAAFDHVIAVGCVDANRVTCSSQSKGPQVDLAAPGVNILTTGRDSDTSYLIGGGTSASAPHVAGAAALLWSAHPEYTNQKVRDVLEATAQDLGTPGRDPSSGAGLVRPDLAIAAGAPTPAFTATFTPVSPNEWWVEVSVSSSSAVSKVEAQSNGGAWQNLAKTSYGTWAKSFNVPKGSMVGFKATSTSGATATASPIQWMGSAAPPPPPPPPSFTATFQVSPNVGEWWVEVSVAGSNPVSGVKASINGAPGVALPATSWGTWAKSFNVPRGSSVVFQATDGYGQVATSSATTWLSPTFSAQFTPRAQTNQWWVETAVTANEPIQKVDVRLNGGAWTSLPATSWGTYAKSIQAVKGTQVEFRATSASGATAMSPAYPWG